MLPVYVPADVCWIQLGESSRMHSRFLLSELASAADQLPEWPPETRVSVTWSFQGRHPEVSVSNPGLPTRFVACWPTDTCDVAVDDSPPESVTVTVTA